MTSSLVGKFVAVTVRPIKNRPGAVWHRALVTAESKTGLQLSWRASSFEGGELVMRDRSETIPKSAITRLRTHRE